MDLSDDDLIVDTPYLYMKAQMQPLSDNFSGLSLRILENTYESPNIDLDLLTSELEEYTTLVNTLVVLFPLDMRAGPDLRLQYLCILFGAIGFDGVRWVNDEYISMNIKWLIQCNKLFKIPLVTYIPFPGINFQIRELCVAYAKQLVSLYDNFHYSTAYGFLINPVITEPFYFFDQITELFISPAGPVFKFPKGKEKMTSDRTKMKSARSVLFVEEGTQVDFSIFPFDVHYVTSVDMHFLKSVTLQQTSSQSVGFEIPLENVSYDLSFALDLMQLGALATGSILDSREALSILPYDISGQVIRDLLPSSVPPVIYIEGGPIIKFIIKSVADHSTKSPRFDEVLFDIQLKKNAKMTADTLQILISEMPGYIIRNGLIIPYIH